MIVYNLEVVQLMIVAMMAQMMEPGADYECWDGEDCDSDVCLSLDGGILNYSSTEDIAGFQFDIMVV